MTSSVSHCRRQGFAVGFAVGFALGFAAACAEGGVQGLREAGESSSSPSSAEPAGANLEVRDLAFDLLCTTTIQI